MQRRNFIKKSASGLAVLALLNKKNLSTFLADLVFNVKMLTKEIGIFTERGGTILFYLGKTGSVVVDAQFPDTAPHCIDEIKKRSDQPFSLLVNTHHHGDHTAGNIAFKSLVPHVLAHVNSKKNQESVAVKSRKEDQQLYPDQTYTSAWSEKFDAEVLSLKYFGRGHTNGDSFVAFEKAGIVHVGDLVFNRRHPFVDRSAGANMTEWIKTLNDAMTYYPSNTRYVCGHAGEGFGVTIGKADILLFRDYLYNVLDLAGKSIIKGMSKEEFLKLTEIPGSPDWKGDGIKRPLEAAWDELQDDSKTFDKIKE